MTIRQNEKLSEVKPYLKPMDNLFFQLYKKFLSQPLLNRLDLPSFGGIYAFYENARPIYVGRADNIKKRISGHCLPGSSHNSANFAFNLARIEFEEKLTESIAGRKALIEHPDFGDTFSKFKKQLSASKIRCIKIQNDIIQTMFEPYLALKLKTYPINNNFDNH